VQKKLDIRYFPLILDVVDEGVFTVDQAGVITSFNKAAERITGYREAEAVGRQCSSVFQTDLCTTVCPLRRSIASGERVRNREVRIRGKDGGTLLVAISTAPLRTAAGTLLGGVEVFSDRSNLEALRRKLDGQYSFEDIVSRNAEMHRIFGIMPMVAESTSTILITGASGTGKELLAKAIHNHGPRRRKPFVAVNCAALPDTLLESELFGYRRGAFTDAKRDRIGRIAQAEGGTLFLDEVGDLVKPLQVKLLRFLQEKTYEPLGANSVVRADVRVITATHRNLEKMVAQGAFRKDLYFRLNVLQIALPRLSERSEDIPLLVRHFIQRFREATGKVIEGISREAMAALLRHDFPGNIRELENIIERAFIVCSSREIDLHSLPPQLVTRSGDKKAYVPAQTGGLDRVEAAAIRSALVRHDGNRTHAARDLGIHRTTLIRKLRNLESSMDVS
jgi:sigma-54 dependent transcriptional regulator, acetoin dehydrogenase operon transcriptional activator AcoR